MLALAAGCSTAPPPRGPVVAPDGSVYPLGTPPTETRASQTATLYIREGRYDRALELAMEGLAADSTNPIHHFLAGVAHARLGNLAEADALFDAAERIYPAYELDVEPEREAAWGRAFNDGLDAYGEGDVERTIALWSGATTLFDLRPEAHSNLASLLTAEGRPEEAIATYRAGLRGLERRPATRVLDEAELQARARQTVVMEERLAERLLVADRYAEAEPLLRRAFARDSTDLEARANLAQALEGLGRRDEAREIYEEILSEEGLAATQLLNLGSARFRARDYATAAEAFGRLTELQPSSRDAWFNYANALFAAESWDALVQAGGRLLELDPLGENTILMTARAHLERGDREQALATLGQVDAAPVFLDDLELRRTSGSTTVLGIVEGNAAEAGSPITLRFTFYAEATRIGEETVTVLAPPTDERATFEVTLPANASSYRYEVLDATG